MTNKEASVWLRETKEIIKNTEKIDRNDCYYDKVDEAIDLAINALKYTQGEWVFKLGTYACSECDYRSCTKYAFCPNCGADMRGDTK